jgi:hypothetical protein
MAKKKIKYLVILAGLSGLLLGLLQLKWFTTIPLGLLQTLAFLSGGVLLVDTLSKTKKFKDMDWTITLASITLVAQYLVPRGYVSGGYDVYASTMVTAGVLGVILLTSRWQK